MYIYIYTSYTYYLLVCVLFLREQTQEEEEGVDKPVCLKKESVRFYLSATHTYMIHTSRRKKTPFFSRLVPSFLLVLCVISSSPPPFFCVFLVCIVACVVCSESALELLAKNALWSQGHIQKRVRRGTLKDRLKKKTEDREKDFYRKKEKEKERDRKKIETYLGVSRFLFTAVSFSPLKKWKPQEEAETCEKGVWFCTFLAKPRSLSLVSPLSHTLYICYSRIENKN